MGVGGRVTGPAAPGGEVRGTPSGRRASRRYAEPPLAVRYRLAPRGVALVPVLRDLMDRARDHLDVGPSRDC